MFQYKYQAESNCRESNATNINSMSQTEQLNWFMGRRTLSVRAAEQIIKRNRLSVSKAFMINRLALNNIWGTEISEMLIEEKPN